MSKAINELSFAQLRSLFKKFPDFAANLTHLMIYGIPRKWLKGYIYQNYKTYLSEGYSWILHEFCPQKMWEMNPQWMCEMKPRWVLKKHPQVLMQFRPFWMIYKCPSIAVQYAPDLVYTYNLGGLLQSLGLDGLPEANRTIEFLLVNAPTWTAKNMPEEAVKIAPVLVIRENPYWVEQNHPELFKKYAEIPEHILSELPK